MKRYKLRQGKLRPDPRGEWVKAEEVEWLHEALTPSAETKGSYIGEFRFSYETIDEDDEPCTETHYVPWTTIKDIMAAIRAKAKAAGGEG